MSVQVTGPLVTRAALRKLGEEMVARLEKETALAAVQTANHARTSVAAGGKTGEVYQKYNPNRTHRASAPGEAPATDTGRLIGSITQQKVSDGWLVGSKVKYSVWLEYGTRTMEEERPFFRPALNKARAAWIERVKNLVGGKNVRLSKVLK